MYINIKKIKDETNFEKIFEYYNISLQKGHNNSYYGCCPIHHGDNPNAFHVNTLKNVFNCFTHCGGGNVIDFVMKMETLTFYKAALKIWNLFFANIVDNDNIGLSFRLSLDYNHSYLKKRNISVQLAKYYHIGYCNTGIMKNRIAIGICDKNGILSSYCGRAIFENTNPKYLFPKKFTKSNYIYNLHNVLKVSNNESAFVVEGFFDVIHLESLGYSAVAIMGSRISERQLTLLQEMNKKYIIMLDGDKSGKSGMYDIIKKMYEAGIKYTPVFLDDNKQPDTLSLSEINEYLKGIN